MKLGHLSNELGEPAELNITPLIDIVFILLIFFVVTATFAKELGLPIERADSSTATEQPGDAVRVAVSRRGDVTVDALPTSPWRLEAEVRSRLEGREKATVVVIADRDAAAETIVDAIDACRRAGAHSVALGVEEASSP